MTHCSCKHRKIDLNLYDNTNIYEFCPAACMHIHLDYTLILPPFCFRYNILFHNKFKMADLVVKS